MIDKLNNKAIQPGSYVKRGDKWEYDLNDPATVERYGLQKAKEEADKKAKKLKEENNGSDKS